MAERAYTVSEIDELRNTLKYRYMFGSSYFPPNSGDRTGRVYREDEMVAEVEQQVRTYMIAGITSDDIVAHDKKKYGV